VGKVRRWQRKGVDSERPAFGPLGAVARPLILPLHRELSTQESKLLVFLRIKLRSDQVRRMTSLWPAGDCGVQAGLTR
jgi:hypothetical protein